MCWFLKNWTIHSYPISHTITSTLLCQYRNINPTARSSRRIIAGICMIICYIFKYVRKQIRLFKLAIAPQPVHVSKPLTVIKKQLVCKLCINFQILYFFFFDYHLLIFIFVFYFSLFNYVIVGVFVVIFFLVQAIEKRTDSENSAGTTENVTF